MTGTLDDLRSLYDSLADDPGADVRVWAAARRSYQRSSTRRRRTLVAAGLTALVTGAGVSTAAAGGWLPNSLARLLGEPVPGAYNPDPDTARVLATGTTVDGEPLTLWYADANNDGYCLFALVGEAGTRRPPIPAPLVDEQVPDLAGGCTGPKDDPRLETFGYQVFASVGGGRMMFIDRAPGVTRATLTLADGTVIGLPIGDGWVAGELTSPPAGRAVLTGFDKEGHQIGSVIVSADAH